MSNFLTTSNRWKHLLGGFIIGIFSGSWWASIYSGLGIGAALEFKDKSYGGKFDYVDLVFTFAGSLIGRTIMYFIGFNW